MAKNLQPISKGIIQDLNQEFQPEATYVFMLNGLFESLEGERGGVVNEKGNKLILNLPTDIGEPHLVGVCLLPNQDKVLFLTGNDGQQDIQIIALHKENNTYKELIRTNCLEYTKCDQIDCIFKVHNGCDIIIYFTDHKNKYKSINITAIDTNTGRYVDSAHVDYLAGSDPNIPTIDPAIGPAGDYGWLCTQFYLTPVSLHPDLYYHKESNSGNLRVGTYTFFIRLLDVDLNPTDWLTWTNPITVKYGDFLFNSPPDNVDGYYNDVNTENFINKSVSLILDNLDTTFQYYEIGVIERSLNTNLPSFTYRSGPRLIPGTTDIFIFNDVNDSRYIDIPISNLLTRTRKVDVVQAHAQISNRLVLGNIKNNSQDWSKFQQAANDIQVEYFTYNTVEIDTPNCNPKTHFVASGEHALQWEIDNNGLSASAIGVNYSSPEFLSYGMSLMRDEVYALGIIFVFRDGTESPVFHIPGRPKFSFNTNPDGTVVDTYTVDSFDYADYAINRVRSTSNLTLDVVDGAPLNPALTVFDDQLLNIGTGSGTAHDNKGSWESDNLTNLPQDNVLANITTDEYKYLYGFKDSITCCYNIPFTNGACSNGEIERWQYYNTSLRRKVETGVNAWNSLDDQPTVSGVNPTYSFSGGFRGVPGYYDTGLPYPNILDCEGNRIFPEGNVRHHKMPDHRIEQIFDKQGTLGLNEVSGTGLTANAAWLATSNIAPGGVVDTGDLYAALGIEPANWQMNDSEQTLKLYPLGINLHNVTPPEEFREDIVGYYIVRSDRANNKTVVDKGFINVCDTSVTTRSWPLTGAAFGTEAVDNFADLKDSSGNPSNNIYTNDFFLTPTHKQFTDKLNFNTGGKNPTWGWWNILEIHTPKSTMNDPVILAADYIKLEASVFGDLYFDSEKDEPTTNDPNSYVQEFGPGTPPQGWNTGASVFMNRHKYPRVQSPIERDWWTFVYNIPISGMGYILYNSITSTNELGGGSTTINNSEYQQRALVAKYNQSCTSVEPGAYNDPIAQLNVIGNIPQLYTSRSVCDVAFPFHYDSLKKDILHHVAQEMYINAIGTVLDIAELITQSNTSLTYAGYEAWSKNTNVTPNYKWSIPHSPYMYYAALKSAINPYEDFDSIRYIKMHSYLIPSSQTASTVDSFAVTGGDTFIQRFQFEKGFYDIEDAQLPTTDNSLVRFLSSLTVGYVESEINSMFRHLLDGDLFRSFPFDERNAYYGFLSVANELGGDDRDKLDDYMDPQKIVNRYKLDYSSYNSEIVSVQLPTTFNYCSQCSESFPNTLIYSEISLDAQVQDFYKLFLTNSVKDIPSYTGSIQNLFVKNSDLYIHTEHNLWKISVAPQQLNTNADVVEVGQGEFLGRDPIKLFNNDDAFSRGGTIDKFTSVYSDGLYMWLDRNSNTLFSLMDGFEPLSEKGLGRWFKNNTEVNLDTQFRALTCLPYPYKGTACNLNVGYIATYDPEHKRYILTKKDYKLLPAITGAMIELTTNMAGDTFVPATVIGQYYYDNDGFYIGIAVGTDVLLKDTLVESLDYTDENVAENKSWTLSYSMKDKAWVSWHSYIPNFIYNDSYTFYSFVSNQTSDINLSIWEHNFGEFQTYYGTKFDFIIDYINKKNPYQDKTFDTIEYTSNVWLESTVDNKWIEVPFTTFDRFYVYNNNQLSNLKTINVANLTPYANIQYDVTAATAHKWRNLWRINRLRDMSVDRLNLLEPKFTQDWTEVTYQSEFGNGFGYIDKVINPSIIDIAKPVYQIERLTDKFLGVRMFFNPEENYKITLNITTGEKRNKI